jgi:hypothetical protein
MNQLAAYPREVLERYIQAQIEFDERELILLDLEYQRETLHRELTRLKEEAEKVRTNIDTWNKIQLCINDIFDDLAQLGRSYDALIK